jgi:hypothetical protein
MMLQSPVAGIKDVSYNAKPYFPPNILDSLKTEEMLLLQVPFQGLE